MNIKSVLHNLSPFNHETEMHPIAYAVKKLLAFFLVYMAAAVIFEVIIIAGAVLLIDIISMIVYFALYGVPM